MAKGWLALLAAFWLSVAGADTVIYQPQMRDSTVAAEQWRGLFRSLRGNGASTLLVQWTRYGDETFGGPGGWLDQALAQAAGEGLDLVLGLYWDPSFFSWAGASPQDLAPRLRSYVRENLATAESWRSLASARRVRGWYLPAELDDFNWRASDKRALLVDALDQLRAGLAGTEPSALSLSAFFGGYLPPREYADWLRELAGRGWFVWVQDGSGTGALTAGQRSIYLETLFPCPAAGLGLVVEAFRQTSGPSESFRARPATVAELQGTREAYRSHCPDRQALFSLRYLPIARGILAYD